jgi:hypothetical protein
VEEVIAENYDEPALIGNEKGQSTTTTTVPSSSTSIPPSTPLLGLNNRKAPTSSFGSGGSSSSSSALSKFQRLGHYGCPNKHNIHHACTQFCVTRWGRGKSQPSSEYNKRRLKMLKKYPLPSAWIEVYDPGV